MISQTVKCPKLALLGLRAYFGNVLCIKECLVTPHYKELVVSNILVIFTRRIVKNSRLEFGTHDQNILTL